MLTTTTGKQTMNATGLTEGSLAPKLPMRKRLKVDHNGTSVVPGTPANIAGLPVFNGLPAQKKADQNEFKPLKRPPMSKARETRLEQNRKAARESRKRKKAMIEELQRSVMFFSRANETLRQSNNEFSRMLLEAQAQVAAIENGEQEEPKEPEAPKAPTETTIAAGTGESGEVAGSHGAANINLCTGATAQNTEGQSVVAPSSIAEATANGTSNAVANNSTMANTQPQVLQAQALQAQAQALQAQAQSQATPSNACTPTTPSTLPTGNFPVNPEVEKHQHLLHQPPVEQQQEQRGTTVQQLPQKESHVQVQQHFQEQVEQKQPSQKQQPQATAPSQQSQDGLLAMQPGAAMHNMAHFQQAAAAAMQSAMQGMSANFAAAMSSPAASNNPQQAYTDAMTAVAMQQAAAAAAASQQFAYLQGVSPFMPYPFMPVQKSGFPTGTSPPGAIGMNKAPVVPDINHGKAIDNRNQGA